MKVPEEFSRRGEEEQQVISYKSLGAASSPAACSQPLSFELYTPLRVHLRYAPLGSHRQSTCSGLPSLSTTTDPCPG